MAFHFRGDLFADLPSPPCPLYRDAKTFDTEKSASRTILACHAADESFVTSRLRGSMSADAEHYEKWFTHAQPAPPATLRACRGIYYLCHAVCRAIPLYESRRLRLSLRASQ